MPKYLVDTTILIGHLRNLPGYRLLLTHLAQEEILGISPISRFEVVQGMRDSERQATLELLNSLVLYPCDAEVADVGGELVWQWRATGVTLSGPDALIAATALCQQASLITINVKDFPMPELQVFATNPEGDLVPIAAATRRP